MQLRKEIGSIMVYSVQKENLGGRREGEAMRGSVSGCAEEVEPLSPAQPGGGRGPDTTEPPRSGCGPGGRGGEGSSGSVSLHSILGAGQKAPRSNRNGLAAHGPPLGRRPCVCLFVHSLVHPGNRLEQRLYHRPHAGREGDPLKSR